MLVGVEHAWWNRVRSPARLGRVRLQNAARGQRNRLRPTASRIAQANSKRAYDKIFRDDALLAEYLGQERLRFYEDVADACVPLAPRTVIDVGCGTGHLLQRLDDRLSLDQVAGIDFSGGAVERARALLPHADIRQADLYTISPPERYVLVVCTEVLEHVSNPAGAMRVLVSLTGDGGSVVATVPDGEQDDWVGHVNFWTVPEFEGFLASFGSARVQRIDGGRSLLAVLTPTRTA